MNRFVVETVPGRSWPFVVRDTWAVFDPVVCWTWHGAKKAAKQQNAVDEPAPPAEVPRPKSLNGVSPAPWTYHSAPSRHGVGRRDWIEDAHGRVVVENVGRIDGPRIVNAVNAQDTPQ